MKEDVPKLSIAADRGLLRCRKNHAGRLRTRREGTLRARPAAEPNCSQAHNVGSYVPSDTIKQTSPP